MLKKIIALGLLSVIALVLAVPQIYKTQRSGEVTAEALEQPVTVNYDQHGVPHIQAQNLDDMYFALGYVHAQDRLFQMESMRRLAKGELAEVFGPDLVATDKIFRTLGLARHARDYVARADKTTEAWRAFEQYLAGVNHYQNSAKLPVEFDLLGIEPRPFTTEDSISVAGYMAYSFAVAMRTEPLMTFVSDKLGEDYLDLFALDRPAQAPQLQADTLASLTRLGEHSVLPQSMSQFEGSNAWAISGSRTANGKPILESDPHIQFGVPGTWYEAHVTAGDFELYGHHLPLVPPAMLGHNRKFGWGITMFQNDDIDFYLERANPHNIDQVWATDQWQDVVKVEETILVKGQAPEQLTVRITRNGPIINDIFPGFSDAQPVSLWWTYTNTDNPMLEAFYGMNHASSIEEFQQAVQGIHAPGLNIMYADSSNHIGWWAAARIPKRPAHVQPWHILDGASGEDSPQGFYDFSFNPQSVDPENGFIVSANHRPQPQQGLMTPGYYNFDARAEKITKALNALEDASLDNQQPLQLDTASDYARDALKIMVQYLKSDHDAELIDQLQNWDGNFTKEAVAPSVFIEWQYQLSQLAFADEVGDQLFALMTDTRKIDFGFYNLLQSPQSPWWNHTGDDQLNTMSDIINRSWQLAQTALTENLGNDWREWQWQRVHTLELNHAFAQSSLLRPIFNIGPSPVPGSHAVPNNLSQKFRSGHQAVNAGPSTRRLIDFSQPEKSLGILPAGQSGNPFDPHYDDQFAAYVAGEYRQQILDAADIVNKRTLMLVPE